MNSKIFKSYDIRGIYPDELKGEDAYIIGRALAKMMGAKRVVLARDARLGSPELHKEITRALVEQGVSVDDIGMVPVEIMYYAVGKYPEKYDGGIMITASHNPKEYAGIKPVRKGVEMIRGKEILEFLESNPRFEESERKGSVTSVDLRDEYIEHAFSFIDAKRIKKYKVVIDAGNGMSSQIMPKALERLPLEAVCENFEPDGNFSAHPSNPLELESQKYITNKVKEEGADMGVIFDGDADRMFFVDEKGTFIRADYILLVLAKEILAKHPGATVVYNVECGKIVPEKIEEWGGKSLRTPVGFVNVSEGMRRTGGVMGGEYSAHYPFKDNFYADSGLIAFLLVLERLSASDKKLSEIIAEFDVYAREPQLNLPTEHPERVIKKIKEAYKDGEMDDEDGIRVSYPDWWFLVRASNTEPIIRVSIEANTAEILEKKKKALIECVKEA